MRITHVGSVLGFVIALSIAAPSRSFAQQTVNSDNDRGFNVTEGNENSEGSKIDDPAKYRLTVPITEHGGGGGVLSFNASREFGKVQFGANQLEMAMLRVEQAEDVRGQIGNLKAEFNFLVNDGRGTDDANMQKALAFTYYGITRISPYLVNDLRNIAAGAGGLYVPGRMTSPGGQYWLQLQADGNYVIYDSFVADDNGDPTPKALFDLWSLDARLDRVDAELRAIESRLAAAHIK
jgi:hypothetical protein